MSVKESVKLVSGVDIITRKALFEMAAAFHHVGISRIDQNFCTQDFSEVVLDVDTLVALRHQSVYLHARPDNLYQSISLVSEKEYDTAPGWAPSNEWSFKLVEGQELKYDLRAGLRALMALEKDGIAFFPMVSARGGGSACDHLPNFIVFRTIVRHLDNNQMHPLAKILADSKIRELVDWQELELGSIKPIAALFEEFTTKEEILRLGRQGDVFYPKPYSGLRSDDAMLYVTASGESKVLANWLEQFTKYRKRLATP